VLGPEAFAPLGWEPPGAERILKALGFSSSRKGAPAGSAIWRRRSPKPPSPKADAKPSPFAALAALSPKPACRPRRRRPRRAAS
jgi:hypothetical protein